MFSDWRNNVTFQASVQISHKNHTSYGCCT